MGGATGLLQAYAARNQWNLDRLCHAAERLDAATLAAAARGSYGSIHVTLVHVVAALDVWLRRLHGESPTQLLSVAQLPRPAVCAAHAAILTHSYIDLLGHVDDGALMRTVAYTNTAGEPHQLLAREILLHVLTHTSDHLAQVATLLTQAGVEPPDLDFAAWVQQRQAAQAQTPELPPLEVAPAAAGAAGVPELSAAAQRVQAELHLRGYDTRVVEMPTSTRTAEEAAAAIGCEVAQIAKSLVFRGGSSGDAILVVASGANRVDPARLAPLLYETPVLADAEFVRERSGYAIGGVPPLAHLSPMTIIIDQDLLHHETIWAAAGTPHAVFRLTPQQLLEMTAGRVCQVA